MKRKDISPTNVERVMREADYIVSKTDTKGIITYGNRIFIEFSGYSENELIGKQHNIIRHPDMPRVVFKLLWDTLNKGDEIFAYVKNMSKDGGFYWVFANVTPSYDNNGKIIGHYSVRRKPSQSAVDTCDGLYKLLLEEEQKHHPKDAMNASGALLGKVLADKGVTYEELVLSL
jgi:PAS domain S-box-containing protein